MKPEEDWEKEARLKREKELEEQYKIKTSKFDFVKGIVGAISGDENALKGVIHGNKKEIAQSGKNISTAKFAVDLSNLAGGMVAGGIGSRYGARSAVGVEAGKLKWWQSVPKGGIKNRAGRFEQKKYETKDLVDEIEQSTGRKFTDEERRILSDNENIRAKINEINARPNYYRALGSKQLLEEARADLGGKIKKAQDENNLELAQSRGDMSNLSDRFFENYKKISTLEADITDLTARINDHKTDIEYYRESENPKTSTTTIKEGAGKDEGVETEKGYQKVPTEEEAEVKKVIKPKAKDSKVRSTEAEELAEKRQKLIKEAEERKKEAEEIKAKEDEKPDFSDPVEEEKPDFSDPVDKQEKVEISIKKSEKTTTEKEGAKKPIEFKDTEKALEGEDVPERIEEKPLKPVKDAKGIPLVGKTSSTKTQTEGKGEKTEDTERNPRRTFEDTESSSSSSSSQVASDFSIKTILDRSNIDELLSITIKVATDSYEPQMGDMEFYEYFGQFSVPFIFYLRNRTLYLGFRGTNSISNIITDLQTGDTGESNILADYEIFNTKINEYFSKIEFHTGFIKACAESYEFIIEKLQSSSNIYDNIVLASHSLGGAVGQIFAYVYNNSSNWEGKKPIKYVVSYGQPRALFNKEDYLKKYNDSVPNYIRVWNTNDPVPYIPFKKKVGIDSFFHSSMMSGYTHVGRSFNVKENLSNNNINILLYELIQGSSKQLKALLKEYNLEETEEGLKLLSDEKYLSLLTYCYYENLKKNEIKKDVSFEEIESLNIGVGEEMKLKKTIKEKCDIIKPFGISDLLEANPVVDDLSPIKNFQLSSLSAITISGNKLFSKAHKLFIYQGYIDKLINKQVEERKTLFDIIKDTSFKTDEREINKQNFNTPMKVIGIYEGEFNNNQLISF